MTTPANALFGPVWLDSSGNSFVSPDGGKTWVSAPLAPGDIPLATPSANGLLPYTGVPLGLLPAMLFRQFCSVGADASGGATHITATGVKVGDSVILIANVTDHASAAAHFEATVTVANQIQQADTDLSAKTLVILVIAQS